MNMQTCITGQMIVDNWQTIVPVTLLSIEYIMGLIPNSKAKGLSHLALLMYQNYKAGAGQATPPTLPPSGPAVNVPGPSTSTLPPSGPTP